MGLFRRKKAEDTPADPEIERVQAILADPATSDADRFSFSCLLFMMKTDKSILTTDPNEINKRKMFSLGSKLIGGIMLEEDKYGLRLIDFSAFLRLYQTVKTK